MTRDAADSAREVEIRWKNHEGLTPVLVALVDHTGADFTLHRGRPDTGADQWHVDGESARAHQVHHPRVSVGHGARPGGEASQQPRGDLQRRAEEVQRGNARAVTEEIDRVADRVRLVALAGEPDAVRFVREFVESGRPVAAICHAIWSLVEADVVRGRELTSFPTLQTDVRNAGGHWVDREVVVDGNLVTSRKPDDLPAFRERFAELLARQAT